MQSVIYVYPLGHTVSFTLVANKHVEWVKKLKLFDVYVMDELAISSFAPSYKHKLVLHPGFFVLMRVLQARGKYFEWWWEKFDEKIAVEVCDSDRYSERAVELANMFAKFIVPSRFCVEVAKRSGIRTKVYWLPHGVDPEWYSLPNQWEVTPVKHVSPMLLELYLYKLRRNVKYILFWLWHSPERKGWSEVVEVYRRLKRERSDVVLVLKTYNPNTAEYFQVARLGAINVYGWLDDYEKMLLYDLADVNILFSRGGGFELNCLEALARGIPCVASDWGSWTDYVPPYLRVKVGERVQPLPGNLIHVGYGYKVDVESAVDKILDILDNLGEYRARVLEWREKVLSKTFRWDVIARRLKEILFDEG